jgi:hypothetical protein
MEKVKGERIFLRKRGVNRTTDVEYQETHPRFMGTASEEGCHVSHKHKSKLGGGLLLFGIANLLWLVFRTGTKPTRIVYPCQRAALSNSSLLLCVSIPLAVTSAFGRAERFLSKRGKIVVMLFLLGTVAVNIAEIWSSSADISNLTSGQELRLVLDANNATVFPASDIYAVNGRITNPVSELVNLMGMHDLQFYKSGVAGTNSGPDGLFARDDVVLIKINEQWSQRGGTNTDVLKELIQTLVTHPDGFVGEIVVADNGQGRGSMNWAESNAENTSQSAQTVIDMFSSSYNVSTCDWQPIRGTRVDEYSTGDNMSGYVRYENADPETGIYVSYPKFQTRYGTRISFKYGLWNGTQYEPRLKVINVPVLKTHGTYGVTGCLKHYMGVQSEAGSGGLANGHSKVATGGMGTLMTETRFPTLNILDATWVNARPMQGPSTSYGSATRVNVLMASIDPAALDYWAAKHVLMQTSRLIGYTDMSTLDPDGTGLFNQYLNRTKNVIVGKGYNVTTDENQMNVYVLQAPGLPDVALLNLTLSKTVVGQGYSVVANVTAENQGDTAESFNVTVSANTTTIFSTTVTMESGNSTKITVVWNTTGFSLGNYTISAYAEPLSGELDTADNDLTGGTVHVSIRGDVNVDGKVDMKDIGYIARIFMVSPSAPMWNGNADINGDNQIDKNDIETAAKQFGQYC